MQMRNDSMLAVIHFHVVSDAAPGDRAVPARLAIESPAVEEGVEEGVEQRVEEGVEEGAEEGGFVVEDVKEDL